MTEAGEAIADGMRRSKLRRSCRPMFRGLQAGLIVRMDRVADDEVMVVADLPVAAPARTAFDSGRCQRRTRRWRDWTR
ncbi:hypothetical protein LV457_11355 [Mycobacterium sp. MYCO198283]|uniref:hypothetical protein n=1 Tax=Mycobacterium sp. MYCO198283 TaxID=2883505 RepID=UPI001E56AAA5|nr:hypothetical protein [Mycobacterium sp. MYCO198283]MCG5432881.1 hypothetical protein [Mycobacterium sp. MYCO198283]